MPDSGSSTFFSQKPTEKRNTAHRTSCSCGGRPVCNVQHQSSRRPQADVERAAVGEPHDASRAPGFPELIPLSSRPATRAARTPFRQALCLWRLRFRSAPRTRSPMREGRQVSSAAGSHHLRVCRPPFASQFRRQLSTPHLKLLAQSKSLRRLK